MKKDEVDESFLYLYKKAHQRILHENQLSNEKVNVLDSIVYLNLSNFWDYIDPSMDGLIKLDSIDKARYFKPYKTKLFEKIHDNDKASIMLVFSKPYESFLLVELFYEEEKVKPYEKAVKYGSSKMYLLIFSPEGEIEALNEVIIDYS